MSRAYEIEWVPLQRRVNTKDKIELQVSLLDILPQGDMQQLLRDQLKAKGWTVLDDGSFGRSADGVHVTLSADGKTVTIEAEGARDVSVRGISQTAAEQELERASASSKAQIEAELARKIGQHEPDVRAEVDEAIQRVYVEALKKKASQLGQVESVHEGRGTDGSHEITIKVRT